ncbi:MAG: WG repeat-containing protein [Clostridiales bacterium]|nr:WG repeat-containing protein [Clostridiales bacterium]
MKSDPDKLSVRSCLADGWMLFRKNIFVVIIFAVLMFVAMPLRELLLFEIRWLLVDYRSEIWGWPSNVIPPMYVFPQSLILISIQLLTDLVLGFIILCSMTLVASRSLLRLGRKDHSFKSAYQLMRINAKRLMKVWLFVYVMMISPIYIQKLFGEIGFFVFTRLGTDALRLLGVVQSILVYVLLIIVFVITVIYPYMICHILSGTSGGVIRNSFKTARQTWRLLFKLGVIYFAIYAPVTFLGTFRFFFNDAFHQMTAFFNDLNLGILSIALFPLLWFLQMITIVVLLRVLQVTVMSALFFNVQKEDAFAEVEEESLEMLFSDSDAEAATTISEMFDYRIAPSFDFDKAGEFHCGLARVRKQFAFGMGKWGYVDQDGQLIIPHRYNDAGNFSDGIAVVKRGRRKYYIDQSSAVVIDVAYDEADAFQEGLARVKIGVKEGFIDHEGDLQALPYETICGFSEGLAPVYDGTKWLYIDKTMRPVLEIKYDEAKPFSEGFAAVKAGRLWGYIDRNGNEVIKPQFEQAGLFKEKRAVVCVDGKFGHIDMTGKFITPPEYEEARDFGNGFAVVRDTYFGYVDMDGVERIPPAYLDAQSFSEGMAWVETVNGWGILEIRQEK